LDLGVFKSTNGGTSWTASNTGMTYTAVQALAIAPSNGQVLYAGTNQLNANSGIYVSTNGGANWTRKVTGIQETSLGVQCFAIHPTNPSIALVAIFDGVADSPVGVYKTTDQGNNWVASNTGMDVKNVLSLAYIPSNPNIVLAGSSFTILTSLGPSKIYKSTDGGSNWTVSTGTPIDPAAINPIRFLSVSTLNNNHVFAGTFMNTTDGGAYFSTDAGSTWTKKWGGAPSDVGTLLRSGIIRPGTTNEVYVGLDRSTPTNVGVWKSVDGGATWASFNGGTMLDTYGIRALIFKDLPANSTLYAGVATTNGPGIHEYTMDPVPVELISFNASVNENNVELTWITATELNNRGFYIERKAEGSSWTNIGFVEGHGTTAQRHYYSYSDQPGAEGTYQYRLKQTDFNGDAEYSNEIEVQLLSYLTYTLEQNYPNPFNPSTTISYAIPSEEHVTLKIYNILGSEVAELVNGTQMPGSYTIQFNGEQLSSGLYFYSLTAGKFSETRKMILSK
jgi:photosystem II stability/assembly factor-like uncharacterized protein